MATIIVILYIFNIIDSLSNYLPLYIYQSLIFIILGYKIYYRKGDKAWQ